MVAVGLLEMLEARDKRQKLGWNLRITLLYTSVIKNEEHILYINVVC